MGEKIECSQTYKVIMPEGTHLGKSSEVPGASSLLAFSNKDNSLVGQAVIIPVSTTESNDNKGSSMKISGSTALDIALPVGNLIFNVFLKDKVEKKLRSWIEKKFQEDPEEQERKEEVRRAIAEYYNNQNSIKNTEQDKTEESTSSTEIILGNNTDLIFNKHVNDDERTLMTSDEAIKELVEAFIHFVISIKKMNKLQNSIIFDSEKREYIELSDLFDYFCKPENLNRVNEYLSNNIQLLEQLEINELSEAFGRELIVDMKYIPINLDDMQNCL